MGVLFSSWIVMTFLNLFHVFITSPQVIETNGNAGLNTAFLR